jgi:hypothetical protein
MLKRPLPARTRKLSGSIAIAVLMAAASYAAWAAQPATPAASQAPAAWLTHVDEIDWMGPPVYPADLQAKGVTARSCSSCSSASTATSRKPRWSRRRRQACSTRRRSTPPQVAHPSALEGKSVERRVRTQVDFELHDKQPKQE